MELCLVATTLASGLGTLLWVTPADEVNVGYFRSSTLVVLGLWVVALLAGWGQTTTAAWRMMLLATVVSYVAFVNWHRPTPTAARYTLVGLTATALGIFALLAWSRSQYFLLEWASLIASALLGGAALAAMLLGHYYLTAPWMSLRPLKRIIAVIAIACGIRGVAAVIAFAAVSAAATGGASDAIGPDWLLYLGVRWAIGLVAPLVLAVMAWQALRFNNTQAATGILYVVVIVTLFGEVIGIALCRMTGVPL